MSDQERDELMAKSVDELKDILAAKRAQLDAMTMVMRWKAAFELNDYGQMVEAVGLTDELIVNMSMQEIHESMQVRLSDAARILNIPFLTEQ